MRYPIFIALLSVSLAAQQNRPPNCNDPIARDVDARCSCYKDPNSEVCALAKKGFYDGTMKMTPLIPSSGIGGVPPGGTVSRAQQTQPQPVQPRPVKPQAARVVPLAHSDYLRFLDPNARLALGFNFDALLKSPEIVANLFGPADGQDARTRVLGALKEMDHLWLSDAGANDVVLLMTGKFEQGVTAGMFYAQGVRPVFLGGAHAMMVGAEPSIQAALARLAKPATTGTWVARRARELSKDHETWIVTDLSASNSSSTALQSVRQFALGFKLTGEAGLDGEAIADSEANAEKIAGWVDQMKTSLRGTNAVGALDALTIERTGSTLRFAAKDKEFLDGGPGKAVMNSEFGVELYSLLMAGLPGMPSRTVATDKLQAVKTGMKRDEVLALLGKPASVSTIQGLDPPRETWTYQVPFGKQFSMKLEGGVVIAPPR